MSHKILQSSQNTPPKCFRTLMF